MTIEQRLENHRHLRHLVSRLLETWPAHKKFVAKSLEDRPADVLELSDRTSLLIKTLGEQAPGGLERLCSNYRFLCERIILPEELHFRREGTYRLSRFVDAEREVYANAPYMCRYVDGILMSGVMWINHAQALTHYVNRYLPSLPPGADHLEIGPGHGLLLYFAADRPGVRSVTGWDVSPTSIAKTREALEVLGVTRPVSLALRNPFDAEGAASDQRFDSIVLSEILEHLEDPVGALRAVRGLLKPGGRVWVNVPANSPAPDHIFLVTGPASASDLVRQAGFDVEDTAAYAMTGVTLDRALRQKLTVSCVVTGRRN